MKIHIATDHAGFELKSKILDYLISKGHEVIDHGAKSFDPDDDYPDYIFPCAKAVSKDKNSYGIILGGSGQGEAIAANRIRGVRAIVYYGFEKTIQPTAKKYQTLFRKDTVKRRIATDNIWNYSTRDLDYDVIISDPSLDSFQGKRNYL